MAQEQIRIYNMIIGLLTRELTLIIEDTKVKNPEKIETPLTYVRQCWIISSKWYLYILGKEKRLKMKRRVKQIYLDEVIV